MKNDYFVSQDEASKRDNLRYQASSTAKQQQALQNQLDIKDQMKIRVSLPLVC